MKLKILTVCQKTLYVRKQRFFSISLCAKIAHLQENETTHAAAPPAASTPEVCLLGSHNLGACMFSFLKFRTQENLPSLRQLLAKG